MVYDFDNLAGEQRALLAGGGWTEAGHTRLPPLPKTVRPLIDRGLIEVHRRPGLPDEYIVPPAVKAAWREFLADEVKRMKW